MTNPINPFQPHYTLGELAKQWHFSRRTLVGWFRDVPDVIRYRTNAKLKKGRKQIHESVRVPESVARRVYRERTGHELNGKA